jgi:adenylate kinase family enzyme
MTSEWAHGSYQQLEDALKEMYALGKQQAVCGVPLQTLHWHLRQRYLDSERKAIWKVGEYPVEEMVRWKRCTCQFEFRSTTQARAHIEHVHKPKPELTQIYSKQYQQLLHDQPGRCELCEKLAIRWLVGWFLRHGITPRLPKEKT